MLDMPLYALEDIVNHYVQKVLALQISLGVLVTNWYFIQITQTQSPWEIDHLIHSVFIKLY